MNNLTRSAFDGRAITPKADPSSVVQVPWNNVTLTFGATGSANLTVANILAALQVVFPTTTLYQIQIKSARLWETTGVPIACIFNALDVSNPGALKHQDDFPARNQWARLGYIWPRSHQNQVLNNASAGTLQVLQVSSGATAVVTLHLEITWKPIVVPGPTFSSFESSSSANVFQHVPSDRVSDLNTILNNHSKPYVSTNFETSSIPCSFPDPPDLSQQQFYEYEEWMASSATQSDCDPSQSSPSDGLLPSS
jgi:hypothetical protein